METALYPVVAVEDELSGFGLALDIVRQLYVELEAVVEAVPCLNHKEVCAVADKERAVEGVILVGVVEVEVVPVELAAGGADAVLIVSVRCCRHAATIRIGYFACSLALTVSSCGSIDLT